MGSALALEPVFEPGVRSRKLGGSLELWSNDAYALGRARARVLDWRRTPPAIRSAPFDGILLQAWGCAGRIDLAPSEFSECGAGDVVAMDMNRPFRLQARSPLKAAHVSLWIPSSRLSEEIVAGDLKCLRLPAASAAGALAGASLSALADRVSVMNEADFRELTGGVVELLGRLLGRELRHSAREGPREPLDTFATVRRFVDRNLTSPQLGAPMIARTFGLSRASIYRLFEPVGGVSSYIRKRRLRRAFEEITAPRLADRRVGPIAFSLGFRNFSAFSRLFRATYGVTPSEARKASASPLLVGPGKRSQEPSSPNLFSILAGLS